MNEDIEALKIAVMAHTAQIEALVETMEFIALRIFKTDIAKVKALKKYKEDMKFIKDKVFSKPKENDDDSYA